MVNHRKAPEAAESEREGLLKLVPRTRAYLPVGGIHPRRVDADEDLTRLRLRGRGILVTEHPRRAVVMDSNSFHHRLLPMQYDREEVRISRRSLATAGVARHSFSSVFVARRRNVGPDGTT